MDPAKIILILDPGSSTGYCLCKIDDKATVFEYGHIDVNIASNFQGDHCIDLMKQVEALLQKYTVTHIAIEDYFFSKRFCTGSNVNAAFRTAIHILARQHNLEYTILNISAWKTFVAGRSTPTKEQKTKWGAEAAKKLYIQQALWEKFNIRFPNHSISTTTGKPIVFRYDVVDVVAQTIYYCCMVENVNKKDVVVNVNVPEDVVWKKKAKKVFEY